MRKIFIFLLVLSSARGSLRAGQVSKPALLPETLSVRAVSWDPAWKPATEKEWAERVVAEVAKAVKDGADAIVFPEGFSTGRRIEGVFEGVKAVAGPERLVVLGHAPFQEPGKDFATSRAYIKDAGAWVPLDKLDPTPAERAAKPPIQPGMRLVLFRFRGGLVAVLPAYSILKPEIAVSLKKRGVSLVLVCAPVEDEAGRARLERAASARAVELGAAVVIVAPAVAPSFYLPAQKGFELKAPLLSGHDIRIPWKKLLELRVGPGETTEARPFLDPAPAYQIEI